MKNTLKKRCFLVLCTLASIIILVLFLATRSRIEQPSDRTRSVLESNRADSFFLRYELSDGKSFEYTLSISSKVISDEFCLLEIIMNEGGNADLSVEKLHGELKIAENIAIPLIFVGEGSEYYVPETSYQMQERIYSFQGKDYFHLVALTNKGAASLDLRVTIRENSFFLPRRFTTTEHFSISIPKLLLDDDSS